ncbi:hypothetical protein AB9M92_15680 [Peribacillus frigoritolerans]|uniref:hypothetical protein n=1 Tax=Peribacillus frigoritolerans TaxID=450367 RepID=UPI003518CDF8
MKDGYIKAENTQEDNVNITLFRFSPAYLVMTMKAQNAEFHGTSVIEFFGHVFNDVGGLNLFSN